MECLGESGPTSPPSNDRRNSVDDGFSELSNDGVISNQHFQSTEISYTNKATSSSISNTHVDTPSNAVGFNTTGSTSSAFNNQMPKTQNDSSSTHTPSVENWPKRSVAVNLPQASRYQVINSRMASARHDLKNNLEDFIKSAGLEQFAREGGMYEKSGVLSDPKVGHLVTKSKDEVNQLLHTVTSSNGLGSSTSVPLLSKLSLQSTSEKTTNPTDRLKRFAEEFEEDPRALKRMRFSGASSQREEMKNSKGLRHFALKVCQKVQAKGVTSYTEVADELVLELQENTPFPKKTLPRSDQVYDQKNIRRRVYDALNVLTAINIISKDKKEIRWIGLPTNSAQELQNLENERHEREQRISQKKEQLQELIMQHVAFKNLVKQNKEFEASNGGQHPDPNTIIRLPFIVINTSQDTDVDCSIASDRREYLFNFDKPFEVYDDVNILKRLGLCLGLEKSGNSSSDLDSVLQLLPQGLHSYVEQEYGRRGTANGAER